MFQKVILLLTLFVLAVVAPLNSAPNTFSTEPIVSERTQVETPKQKRLLKRASKNHAAKKMGQPVLPAIALSLGIIAVVVFILAGLPGIFIGLAAIVVGSVVLTRRNGYDRKDRIMARVGVLLGSLFSILGLLILLALFDIFVVGGELFESLYEHVLG
ncbi:MAG: hypothetical protein AAFN10_10675 [Bacteroidota bacterium]